MHPPKDDNAGSTLSPRDIEILITIERAGAGLSMGAIVLTVLCFVLLRRLRTTPNLFLVFASMANAGASVASMMGYDGLDKGEDSSLCQVQGFIFEWFMQSDPWWSFAMAINVFLVFFCNVDPAIFRKYVWVYCLVCFGGPMIPAIVLLSIRDDLRGPIFGNAALWCWIGNNWGLVRLYAYYIPIWICIFLSIVIYIAVGFHVFHQRNQLRNLALRSAVESGRSSSAAGSDGRNSADSFTGRRDIYGTVTTEVQDTSLPHENVSNRVLTIPPPAHISAKRGSRRLWIKFQDQRINAAGVSRSPQPFQTTCSSNYRPVPPLTTFTRLRAVTSSASLKLKQLDPIKMAYLRTSFIFGFAILITWIPSSVNRVYSLTHNDRVSFPLSIASGCVLPLQGVWNAIIFFMTSGRIVREEIKAMRARFRKRGRKSFANAGRIDSRMDIVGYESRNTFERCRALSGKHGKQYWSSPCEIYDLEIDQRAASLKCSL